MTETQQTEIKLYSFSELSEKAQVRAYELYHDFYHEEGFAVINTIKKGLLELFSVALKSDYEFDFESIDGCYFEIDVSQDDEKFCIELNSSQLNEFFKKQNPKFYASYREKRFYFFTGISYDYAFLKPVYDALNFPGTKKSLLNLAEDCVWAAVEAGKKDCQYYNSIDYFHEICKLNNFKFTQKGKMI